MATKRDEIDGYEYEIIKGPSKFELMLAVFDNPVKIPPKETGHFPSYHYREEDITFEVKGQKKEEFFLRVKKIKMVGAGECRGELVIEMLVDIEGYVFPARAIYDTYYRTGTLTILNLSVPVL
jgi:hypothetical protein